MHLASASACQTSGHLVKNTAGEVAATHPVSTYYLRSVKDCESRASARKWVENVLNSVMVVVCVVEYMDRAQGPIVVRVGWRRYSDILSQKSGLLKWVLHATRTIDTAPSPGDVF